MRATFCVTILSYFTLALGFQLPPPSGKYNVTLTTSPLVDQSRTIFYNGTSMPRTLMLSVFQPATCASTGAVPYMPVKTAQFQGRFLQEIFGIPFDLSPLFLNASLIVCSGCSSVHDSPILLFSHGYSVPRLYYCYLASTIASRGFTVVTIDHPEDANIITYPDGRTIINNDTAQTDATFARHLPARVADIQFILTQLRNATITTNLFPERRQQPPRADHIAAFGHSLGGAAAIQAAARDSRIRAAIDWDGTIFGSLPSNGLTQPILLVQHDQPPEEDWQEDWPKFKGPKLWIQIANSTHETFSDIPTLLQSAGHRPAALGGVLGTIKAEEMVSILAEYTTTWMRAAFAGEFDAPLLHKSKPHRFPEVSVEKRANY